MIAEMLAAAGHETVVQQIVADEPVEIERLLRSLVARAVWTPS